MIKECICATCGYVGRPKTVTKGSTLIELALWIFFLIPGLIYSVWRLSSRHKACPACSANTLIPLETPTGKKLLSEQGKTVEQALAEIASPSERSTSDRVAIGVAIALGVLFIVWIYQS